MSKKKILVVGSVAIDNTIFTKQLPQAGATIMADSYMVNVGGKGANQACASTFLGGEVSFIGAVGKDQHGAMVKQFLNEVGLKAYLKDSNKPTGVAFIILDELSGENRILIVQGANTDISVEDIEKHDNLFKEGDILLTQFENSVETVEYMLKKAFDRHMLVVLNPAPYKKINEDCYKYIDYIVPNETELEMLTGTKDIELGAKMLLEKGVKNVIVTLGSKGSLLMNHEATTYVEPYKVNAVDTTAAGDSYLGALVTKLAEGKDIISAMKFASLASSVTVTRKGAIISLPHLKDLI